MKNKPNGARPRPSYEDGQIRDSLVEELQDKEFTREEFLDALSGAALARKEIEKFKQVPEKGE